MIMTMINRYLLESPERERERRERGEGGYCKRCSLSLQFTETVTGRME